MREISARELREWYAYEKAYGPIGAQRIDYAAALIAERITNTNIRRAKSAKPASLDTFLLRWGLEVTEDDDDS